MKKTVLLSFSALIVTLLLSATVSTGTAAARESAVPVSPALNIIADCIPMAKAGIEGNDISFVPEDFERCLDISRVSSLMVTQIPDITDGELLIGSAVVKEGQTISRENLSLMCYKAANEGKGSASFRFCVNNQPYSITCSLYLLDGINYSPTAKKDEEITVSTYRDVAAYGRLYAKDPEGDPLTYQITSYPEHGIMILYDGNGGYVYMPNKDFTGTDKLSYVVYDKYGNYSAESTVRLSVSRNSASLAYSDMKWNHAYSAAIKLAENGIMSGSRVGNVSYFYPDKTVSRGEFLMMAMKAAGIKSLPSVADTGFSDDASVPSEMKPYIGAAARAGYIKSLDCHDGCFSPDKSITVAEAAEICFNIAGLEYGADIPVWSDACGVLSPSEKAVFVFIGDGTTGLDKISDFHSAITRADAALLLKAVAEH